ncbi:hypothetical protein AB1Y20_022159 [Prymnesium parvum]|uniref:Uncharacterized protein n=1 Tax=Prymnesium parvum TaxID=97485 RepID=A0AB34JI06_PRYPA|mmetsp:Transcript_42781/g.98142  ORF Transcript_42781/g.98142 Transcript_42781/m.98142 type:complete len:221 (-) Transcript_42781:268-930(-)
MIVPNLHPGQKPLRPTSASLRTPRGGEASAARQRAEGQATPRLRPATEGQPTPEEDEPWLFRFEKLLSTGDVWRMGFSRLIVLNAQGWADEPTAAAEICEAFQSREGLPSLALEHKLSLESAVAPAFLRGDVLISIRCDVCSTLPDPQKHGALNTVGKLIDAVSNVWTQYDEMEDPELGAVVVVLEGFEGDMLTCEWSPGDVAPYPVTHLDQELTQFLKP